MMIVAASRLATPFLLAVALANGQVLVSGGENNAPTGAIQSLANAELYSQ